MRRPWRRPVAGRRAIARARRRLLRAPEPCRAAAISRGLNLAIMLLHRGEAGEARELLRRAVVLSPGDAHIHAQLGQLALQQGDAAAAVTAFREAVRLAPGDRGFHFLLGQALRRSGQSAEAQHEFAEAARLATQAAAPPRLP